MRLTRAPIPLPALPALLVLVLTACLKPGPLFCSSPGSCAKAIPNLGTLEPQAITLKPGESKTVTVHLLEHTKDGPYRLTTTPTKRHNLHLSVEPDPVPAEVRTATITVGLDEDALAYTPTDWSIFAYYFPYEHASYGFVAAEGKLTINRVPPAVATDGEQYLLDLTKTESATATLRLHRELAGGYDGPVFFEATTPRTLNELGVEVSISPNPLTGDAATITFKTSYPMKPDFIEPQWVTVTSWRGTTKSGLPFDPVYRWQRFSLYPVPDPAPVPVTPPATGNATGHD